MTISRIEPVILGLFGKEWLQEIAEETINNRLTDKELEDMVESLLDDFFPYLELSEWFKNYMIENHARNENNG